MLELVLLLLPQPAAARPAASNVTASAPGARPTWVLMNPPLDRYDGVRCSGWHWLRIAPAADPTGGGRPRWMQSCVRRSRPGTEMGTDMSTVSLAPAPVLAEPGAARW